MKKRIFTIAICLLIIAVLLPQTNIVQLLSKPSTAFAVGDLTVNWGLGLSEGDPIFVVNNMAPGDMETRVVDVSNGASSARPLGVKGILDSESGSLSTVLDIVIQDGATDVYGGTSSTGPKTLSQFFADSLDPDGIPLSLVGPGETKNYTFKVTFQESSGNEFQEKSIVFGIILGIAVKVPEECSFIDLTGKFPIFGTSGNDKIFGTHEADVIFGFEGNDKIFSHSGDDCIVGGPGNDELRGELDNDFIFGNEGNDLLIGANGMDTIFGGTGNDTIRGENNQDKLFGEDGNDTITGGNSEDEIDAGDGNDWVDGENSPDEILGGSGEDTIRGGAGQDMIDGGDNNDTIVGGAGDDDITGGGGVDFANGHSGTDTCDAETETNCEL